MSTFQIILLVILGTVGMMAVAVLFQMWRTLRAVEQILTVEIRQVADEIRRGIEEARHTIQETTLLVSSLKDNFGHVNSTVVRLSDSVLRVAEMFQGPWMRMLGFVNEAVGFVKKVRQSSKSPKRK